VDGEAVNEQHPDSVLESIGALLARVHEVECAVDFAGNATWSGWMGGWLSHALGWWAGERPDDAVRGIDLPGRLEHLSSSMEDACSAAILFDGRPDHLLVTDDGGIAMIDVEELRRGDPAMDIAVLSLWIPTATPRIVRGYRAAGGPVGTHFDERVSFYRTLRTLAAAEWHQDQLADADTARVLLDRAGSAA
jgi:aminoglycoside phosphotransferase (APT) family kinase protein